MMDNKSVLGAFLVASLVVSSLFVLDTVETPEVETQGLKTFSSMWELDSYIEKGFNNPKRGGPIFMEAAMDNQAAPPGVAAEYSETNIQVAGVDEADIVKTDGKYIFLVTGNSILIVNAYPANQMQLISNTTVDGRITGLFVNQDRLIIFEENPVWLGKPRIMEDTAVIDEGDPREEGAQSNQTQSEEAPPREPADIIDAVDADVVDVDVVEQDIAIEPMIAPYVSGFHIKVYDTTQKTSPELVRDVSMNGTYINSRMIDEWVYVIASQSAVYWIQETYEVVLPALDDNGELKEVPVTDVHYSDNDDIAAAYTMIIAVNIQDESETSTMKVMLSGFASTLYVSQRNIYVVEPDYSWWSNEGKTVVHRISINQGQIAIEATGTVPGQILNQYSLDEYENHLRIATTTATFDRENSESSNNVYVLNQQLETVGTLEDLAPGEQIFSARFIGAKGYLVTFRNIDPLFTIDLSNPQAPTVLGQLKIPGFSNYLHSFDENHIIGIGKDAVPSKNEDFAWYQGVKISLFNIADPDNPIQVSTFLIGDRGTESPVLYDPHALLFDARNGLMVFPILEAKINPEKYQNGVPPETYGEYIFQGAYALNIDAVTGITLKGTLTHIDNPEAFLKSGYYMYSPSEIIRSLYIDDTLYTISNNKISAHDIDTLKELATISLEE
jgi:uncharacterized secreted protein with C-terminal beta-propeller domain